MCLTLHISDVVAGDKVRRARRLGTPTTQNATNKFKKGETEQMFSVLVHLRVACIQLNK